MSTSSHPQAPRGARRRDEGTILPLVLIMAVVISAVIVATTGYVSTSLRYSQTVEARADRLAAADGGLRYAMERLTDSQYAKCLSNLGQNGTEVKMPVQINGADVTVTCYERDGGIARIKAWALILTGEGVPGSEWLLRSSGAGGSDNVKVLGGPVWVSRPDRTDLAATVNVEDGDIWYYESDCSVNTLDIGTGAPYDSAMLKFTPEYRGLICVDQPWNAVFSRPLTTDINWGALLGTVNPPPDTTTYPGCTIFRPGYYNNLNWLTSQLGQYNYFQAGDYLLHGFSSNDTLDIQQGVVTAGFAYGQDVPAHHYGDQQFIDNVPCEAAINADRAARLASADPRPGATFYMAGRANIDINNQGSLEILRRPHVDDGNLVSIQTINCSCSYNHTLNYNDNIVNTQSGGTSDIAIHGLLWAPRAMMTFGNVTNDAEGQLLGGAALARIDMQASASASGFVIRVETAPIAFTVKLIAEAVKDGQTTTMSAIVEVDDRLNSATNSVRVVEN